MNTEQPQLNKDESEVVIAYQDLELKGILSVPSQAKGLVIFAHGSGSSRLSKRNNFVARELRKKNLGTLLMDLLTPEEENDRAKVFDINLLAQRLTIAKSWRQTKPGLRELKIAYFGASTGAGAALVAAAQDPRNIFAVVSRGGRPDLAETQLWNVKAPTLLIVGGDDDVVIDLNRQAYQKLNCLKKIEIIPGATHLFEEPGTLEQVALLAADWFTDCLASPPELAEGPSL